MSIKKIKSVSGLLRHLEDDKLRGQGKRPPEGAMPVGGIDDLTVPVMRQGRQLATMVLGL